MRKPSRGQLFVRALSRSSTRGLLTGAGYARPCALGRSGRRALKREGDGATPAGTFLLERVLYRPDRCWRPRTGLHVSTLSPADGWCDAAEDRNYNRPVRHPYPASAEVLWRSDGLYDVIVVLDCNRRPRIRGRGSAIFMHVARPGYQPTEGCIALRRADLLQLLAVLRRGARIHIP
ncbi:MAG: L,D-transpeptidase family protein [Deltaproteobacteria bacterium]